jgi:hypothetical protein
VIVTDPDASVDDTGPVTLARLEAAIESALDRHVELAEPRWLTRFGDAARQAERYIDGRVILAGDAAHIHPPAGAIGVNVAIDDAFNLGWKLAATIRHNVNPGVLASYETERIPAGADILANTRAQALLQTLDASMDPLKDLFTRVARHPAGNRALAEIVTGLSIRYPMPGYEGTPPDVRIGTLSTQLTVTIDGRTVPVQELTGNGEPVLLLAAGTEGSPTSGDVRSLAELATAPLCVHEVELPHDPDLRAVLIRPDGYIAAILPKSSDNTTALSTAITTWAG